MITIYRIDIEGFGSISRPLTHNFNNGLYFLKGSNGAGKTTIFSALTWCLFQTNLKGLTNEKVSTWSHLRHSSYKGTKVVVYMTANRKQYRIERFLDYKGKVSDGKTGSSRLLVYVDGVVYTGQHKADHQQLIESVLGMDAPLFLNAILFGQSMSRLVAASNEEKRKVFDRLFALDFVETAKDKAKQIKSEQETKVAELTAIAEGTKKLLQNAVQSHSDLVERNTNLKKQHQAKIDRIKKDIEEVITFIKKNEELQKDLLQTLEDGAHSEKVQEYDRITDLLSELAAFTEAHKETLKATHDQEKEHFDTEETELNRLLQQCQQEIRETEAQVSTLSREHTRQLNRLVDSAEANIRDSNQMKAKAVLKVKQLKTELESLQSDRYKLEAAVPEVCHSCDQPLPAAQIAEALEKRYRETVQIELKINNCQKDLDSMMEVIKTAEKDIDELNTNLGIESEALEQSYNDKKENLDTLIKDLEATGEELKTAIQDHKKKREFLIKTYQEQLAAIVLDYKKNKDALYHQRDQVEREAKELNQAAAELQKAKEEYKEFTIKVNVIQGYLEEALNQETEPESETPLLNAIAQYETEYQDAFAKLEQATVRLNHANWWIKSAFGANGIKAYIFSAMLQTLNKLLTRYASSTGFTVEIGVNFDRADKSFYTNVYKEGVCVDYEELSGGQKQRVNIVVAFALSDMVGSNINIMLLDEVFESLDNEGIELVFELLRSRSQNKAIQLVTHLESADTYQAKTLEVVLNKDLDGLPYTMIRGEA